MLRDAINEIRFHPGRFVATLMAIAISVGFMAAIVVGVSTEENSVQRATVLPLSRADLVVNGYLSDDRELLETVRATPGVEAAEGISVLSAPLGSGDRSAFFNIYALPSPEFRWAELAEGSWPANPGEIVVSADGAKSLGLAVGAQVEVGFGADVPPLKVVGITNDAPSLYAATAYVSRDTPGLYSSMWAVKTADPAGTKAALTSALGQLDEGQLTVSTAAEFRHQQLMEMTGQFDIFRNLLLAFAGVALLVGMIIIANTFTILVTQRRRQIGLLRAVGASTAQVGWRLVLEGALLGFIGSLLGIVMGIGVAALVGVFTKSLYWGLVIPWGQLAIAVLVGVLATVVSVIGPSLNASRVSPLEALQVVPSPAKAKRIGRARAVVCGALILLSLGLLSQVVQQPTIGLVWAILGGGAFSIAALVAAPLYVPALLRLSGRILGFFGPTVRLAAANAARNPRRASATAVALMLAMGLIVTLQVGVSSVKSTALHSIDETFPVDVSVATTGDPLPDGVVTALQNTGVTKQVLEIESKPWTYDDMTIRVRDINTARAQLGLSSSGDVADDEIYLSQAVASMAPTQVELPGVGALTVKPHGGLDMDQASVSAATFAKLEGQATVTEAWVKLNDRTSMTAISQVDKALKQYEGLNYGGGAMLAGILTQVINVILIVLTGLLGVAVLIALVGVGNTLGLSVLERQRESALLRALGMQRGSLRMMLLVEAMLLGIVGVGVGIVMGAAMGWLGVVSAIGMIPEEQRPEVVFSVDLLYTGGLMLICLVAAALASVLPGRKAANATPTQALAVE